jgi:hypothetical protein
VESVPVRQPSGSNGVTQLPMQMTRKIFMALYGDVQFHVLSLSAICQQ